MVDQVPDSRAPGLPDVPYSAFCKICWQSVYALWIDKDDHKGVCPFGASKISDCKQAIDWERAKGSIKSYLSNNAGRAALERSEG